jgi:hypothetical protein
MSLTNFLENALLNHIRGGTAYTQPSSLHVKLHLGDPGEDATGNPAGETTRVAVTFGAASGGSMANDAEVLWENVSNTEALTHFSVWDNSTAGNPLGYGALGSTVNITAGEDARFAVGALTWTLD